MTIPADTPPGTRVRFKTEQQLIDQFGSLRKVPAIFDRGMLPLCGTTARICKLQQTEGRWWRAYVTYDSGEAHKWSISCEMLELVDPHEERKRVLKILRRAYNVYVADPTLFYYGDT